MFGLDQRLEFNGQDLTRWCVIEDIRLPLMAPVRNDWHDRLSTQSGKRHRRSQSMQMVIEIDARLWEQSDQTLEEVAAELAACLKTDGPAVLSVNGRNYNAVIDGSITRQDWFDLNSGVRLQFVCGDGTWFSDEITLDLTAGSNVTALGSTADTPAVIKLTASGAVSTVKAKIGTDEITIKRETGTWPKGTVFTIDTEDGMVLIGLNDGRKYLTLDSRFGLLKPGNNTVVLTGGGGSIAYYPRWK